MSKPFIVRRSTLLEVGGKERCGGIKHHDARALAQGRSDGDTVYPNGWTAKEAAELFTRSPAMLKWMERNYPDFPIVEFEIDWTHPKLQPYREPRRREKWGDGGPAKNENKLMRYFRDDRPGLIRGTK